MNTLYIESAGICAPSIPDWMAFKQIVQNNCQIQEEEFLHNGEALDLTIGAVIPPASILPPNERRRTTKTIKIALHCMQQLFPQDKNNIVPMASVFASSSGDVDLVQSICMALSTDDKAVSPIQFHNSVHNAAAGYWSIGCKWMHATTSISAANGTFVAALLEAASQINENRQKVALCCYDISSPPPLDMKRPVQYDFGCALVLAAEQTGQSIARLSFQPSTENKPVKMNRPDLETLRTDNPSAAALPLLFALACSHNSNLTLPYLPDLDMDIELTPLPCMVATN